jgi:GNAT superfamily N-acetyltransferase
VRTERDAIAVRLLAEPDGSDDRLVGHLTRLVNEVYTASESGLWRAGMTRTTATEIARLAAAGQLAVAVRDGEPVGCVQVHDVDAGTGEFGMLTASPEHRGTGLGRVLVEFAERRARDRGLRAMRLELLVPRGWRHPHKEFLRSWYERLGYQLVGTTTVAEVHPHLAPLQATPCDVLRYEKPLRDRRERAAAGGVSDRDGPAPRPGGW